MGILFQILMRNFFVLICTPIKNANTVPYFFFRTSSKINSFYATEKGLLLIIKSLDPTKAHGCDNLSVRMIKTCNESITTPLRNFFKESLRNGVFPEICKRANVVPVHKKEEKSLVKSLPYQFISNL